MTMGLIKAQSFLVNAKGGLAAVTSLDCEMGALMTVSLENKVNKYLSVGINAKFGGANYVTDDWIKNNEGEIIEDNELDVANFIYSVSLFPKFSFLTTDELIISLVPEIGYYWTESDPTIYFTDEVSHEVTFKDYNNRYSERSIGYSLNLEGQYFLGDRTNLILCLGWNNYDFGKSLNKIKLEDWEKIIDEEINFFYVEVGIAFRLLGKDIGY